MTPFGGERDVMDRPLCVYLRTRPIVLASGPPPDLPSFKRTWDFNQRSRLTPVRFSYGSVRAWNGSSSAGFRLRRFHWTKSFLSISALFEGMAPFQFRVQFQKNASDGSDLGSWQIGSNGSGFGSCSMLVFLVS